MRRPVAIVLAGALAVLSGPALASRERGKWRLTIGPSVVGGVQSRVGANSAGLVRMSRFGSMTITRFAGPTSGRSKAEAYALGSGEANGGKRVFDGGAWYDPVDSGAANDGNFSWNWRLHDPSGPDPDGKKGYVERTAYSEAVESAVQMILNDGQRGDSTDWLPGLRVEASRELYCSEGERPWGVDLAVAFAYYFQRGIWSVSGTAASVSARQTVNEGYYEWWNDSHDEAQYILDYYRDSQFDGSMWGAGTFDGPGAELATDAWKFRDVVTRNATESVSHTLRYHGDGDYREYSIEMLARPWWEPWEWLRVFASLGIEASRREFEWSMTGVGTDGTYCHESGSEREWRALGLLGGGFTLQWMGFFVMGEALWRFGGDDLSVHGETVHGSVSSGNWGFRASIGYEF